MAIKEELPSFVMLEYSTQLFLPGLLRSPQVGLGFWDLRSCEDLSCLPFSEKAGPAVSARQFGAVHNHVHFAYSDFRFGIPL